MKRILFTGGPGFLGRNLVPVLSKKYDVFAPSRMELDLRNMAAIEKYIKHNHFDVIIHAAIPNIAFNPSDQKETLLRDSLLTFLKLHQMQNDYGKLLYFGSGAEFDKSVPIIKVSENDFGKRIPNSDYGIAKYTMNQLCRASSNIYNLRIFGCYGPTDAYFKLITYAIRCCLNLQPIELNQNCIFDYMYVLDLIPVLEYFIENTPTYHDYNVCSGIQAELFDICHMVQSKLGTCLPVYAKADGFNNEYSGDNSRIREEIPKLVFTPLHVGIDRLIQHEKTCQN